MKNLYNGKGSIYYCGKYITEYEASTWAVSEAKAKSNIEYRFKKENNLLPTAKVNFVGKFTKED